MAPDNRVSGMMIGMDRPDITTAPPPRLRSGYHALVIGATGAIGQAFCEALAHDPHCARLVRASRAGADGTEPSTPALPTWDLRDESSLVALADALTGPFHLVIDATGALTLDQRGPEKRLADLDTAAMAASFQVNAIGPLLLLRHLSPLLAKGERVVWAKLSARVGSIADNRKGGWYSYRMAKAALNQGLQTAAIELARQRPDLVVAALQPGTVRSRLSQPFVGDAATPPDVAVRGMLAALGTLAPNGRAQFIDHAGQPIPW
ncbi:MAG TPA: SDR family NAD(P)-dependent oxidoreductase [Burkholderiaceae bacterium]|nr:SDR family NAD(P)-dependent oxidoreductase [Burkholderiaceae bacterium]